MEGSTDDNTGLRVASFSCYLDAAKENSLHRISPTKFTFAQQPRKKGEISIFGAEKYFNMKLDCPHENNETRNLARIGSNPGPRTPSQKALLRRNGSQKKAIGRRIFSGFGCIQPACFNRKDVHLAYYGSKPAPTESSKEQFANIEEAREVAKNMERKVSFLTWDAIRKGQSHVATSTVACDDMASEASSDLFEIDTISVSHYAASESRSAPDSVHCNEEKSERVTPGDVAMTQTNGNGSNYYRCGGLLGCKSLKVVEVANGRLDLSQKH